MTDLPPDRPGAGPPPSDPDDAGAGGEEPTVAGARFPTGAGFPPATGFPPGPPSTGFPTAEPSGGFPPGESSGGLPPGDGPVGDGPAPGGASSGDLPRGASSGGFPPGASSGGFPPGASSGGFAPGASPGGSPPPVGSGGSSAWVPGGAERRLRRSTQRKVVAGVAGGLGEYTGVDPVLFRVLFAVLTLFGGTGILLYIVGWLFLPADDQPASPAESLIGRGSAGGSGRAADAGTAIVLAVAGLFLAGVLARGDAEDVVVLLVVVGAAYFLLRNISDRRAGGPPPPPAAAAPMPYEPTPPAQGPYATAPGPYATAPGSYAPVATMTAPPPAPPRPRERSVLGAVTISVLLVVLGVMAAVDAADGADPSPENYLAAAVGVLGLGLIVGAFYGRARGLVWFGLPLLAVLSVLGTTGISLRGGVGDRAYAPTRAVEVRDDYRLGVGSLRLDLSAVDLTTTLKRVRVSSGLGDVEVVVPANADVSVDARAGLGEIEVFDKTENGSSSRLEVVDLATEGDGRIDLVLDLDLNVGSLKVTRAQA